jgi:hypothetical protein
VVYFIGKDETSARVVLDDATPFGINLPERAVRLLRDASVTILDAEALARGLLRKLPRGIDGMRLVPFSGGGIMTFSLLCREGLCQKMDSVMDIERTYREVNGKLRPSVEVKGILCSPLAKGALPDSSGTVLIDDVIAAGRTADTAARYLVKDGKKINAAVVLLLSSSVSGGWRTSTDSTMPLIDDLYAAVRTRAPAGGSSAIFSARALLEKGEYVEREAAGKLGVDGKELREALESVDRSPLKLLRSDPFEFFELQKSRR